tara:strand:- start:755 stop:1594 length:840 start_codon:yes stop_codon:yes gene_type:complete
MSSANLTYWTFTTWASNSVSRESMLNALITMPEPEITVSRMRNRIGHGHLESVRVGFEPFNVNGIVDKAPGKGRYPNYVINYDGLKDMVREWETIDLNHGSVIDQHVTKRLSKLCTRVEPHGEFLDPHVTNFYNTTSNGFSDNDVNAIWWSVYNHIQFSTRLAMKILYMKDRFGLAMTNWIDLLSRIIPTRQRVLEVVEQVGEAPSYWQDKYQNTINEYKEIDMKRGFKENMDSWYESNNNIIPHADDWKDRYGFTLNLPNIENNEIFSNDGKGDIICL